MKYASSKSSFVHKNGPARRSDYRWNQLLLGSSPGRSKLLTVFRYVFNTFIVWEIKWEQGRDRFMANNWLEHGKVWWKCSSEVKLNSNLGSRYDGEAKCCFGLCFIIAIWWRKKKAFWQLSAYGNGVMQNKAAMLSLRCRMWPDDQTKSTCLSCFPD